MQWLSSDLGNTSNFCRIYPFLKFSKFMQWHCVTNIQIIITIIIKEFRRPHKGWGLALLSEAHLSSVSMPP